uniref:Uncharacterized protein n=1 Tax=Prorocentrum micans TaxID=2945 RepID=A0A7S2X548_PROMC|mmetsp:Transcript_5656/g.4434  ORF Transcript_5656/g.4434 Transcript_5656/m.4434 type:complete len:101 (+) Transcript_5656:149-451(+)
MGTVAERLKETATIMTPSQPTRIAFQVPSTYHAFLEPKWLRTRSLRNGMTVAVHELEAELSYAALSVAATIMRAKPLRGLPYRRTTWFNWARRWVLWLNA